MGLLEIYNRKNSLTQNHVGDSFYCHYSYGIVPSLLGILLIEHDEGEGCWLIMCARKCCQMALI